MDTTQRPEILARVISIVETIAEEPLEEGAPLDRDLLESGYLDSFGFVQLLLQLGEQFNLEIDEELQLDPRLRHIAGIVDFVIDG
jgi:acyl carrier protein